MFEKEQEVIDMMNDKQKKIFAMVISIVIVVAMVVTTIIGAFM